MALNDLLLAMEDADRLRHQQIHHAWQIYHGDQPKPLRVLPGEPDDNIRLNLAGLVVDTGVDALFGQDIVIQVEGDDGMNDEATSWLRNAYEENQDMLLWQSVATNGAVSGQAAVRLIPPAEGAPAGSPPRVIVVDPEMLRVVWSPDDVGTVEAYVLQWIARDSMGREYGKRQVIYRDGPGWMIEDQVATVDRVEGTAADENGVALFDSETVHARLEGGLSKSLGELSPGDSVAQADQESGAGSGGRDVPVLGLGFTAKRRR